jgi:hypothetical protein
VIVRDLNSRNGTFVNGARLKQSQVKHGEDGALGLGGGPFGTRTDRTELKLAAGLRYARGNDDDRVVDGRAIADGDSRLPQQPFVPPAQRIAVSYQYQDPFTTPLRIQVPSLRAIRNERSSSSTSAGSAKVWATSIRTTSRKRCRRRCTATLIAPSLMASGPVSSA